MLLKFPKNLREEAQKMHEFMVERVAEFDERLTEKFLEGKPISLKNLKTPCEKELSRLQVCACSLWRGFQK